MYSWVIFSKVVTTSTIIIFLLVIFDLSKNNRVIPKNQNSKTLGNINNINLFWKNSNNTNPNILKINNKMLIFISNN